jgi:hypothetical protein
MPVTAETLALCERRYLETKDFEWYFASLSRSIDDRVAALRELPGRFATVRKIAEETPNLEISVYSFPSRRQPNLSQLKRRKPKCRRNQNRCTRSLQLHFNALGYGANRINGGRSTTLSTEREPSFWAVKQQFYFTIFVVRWL